MNVRTEHVTCRGSLGSLSSEDVIMAPVNTPFLRTSGPNEISVRNRGGLASVHRQRINTKIPSFCLPLPCLIASEGSMQKEK